MTSTRTGPLRNTGATRSLGCGFGSRTARRRSGPFHRRARRRRRSRPAPVGVRKQKPADVAGLSTIGKTYANEHRLWVARGHVAPVEPVNTSVRGPQLVNPELDRRRDKSAALREFRSSIKCVRCGRACELHRCAAGDHIGHANRHHGTRPPRRTALPHARARGPTTLSGQVVRAEEPWPSLAASSA